MSGVARTSCPQLLWKVVSHPQARGPLAAAATGAVFAGISGAIFALGALIAYRLRSQPDPLPAEQPAPRRRGPPSLRHTGPDFYRDTRERVGTRAITPTQAWGACRAYDAGQGETTPFIRWLAANPYFSLDTKYYIYDDYHHYDQPADFCRAILNNRHLAPESKRYIIKEYQKEFGAAPPPRRQHAERGPERGAAAASAAGAAPSIPRLSREQNVRIYEDTAAESQRFAAPQPTLIREQRPLDQLPPSSQHRCRVLVVNQTTRETAQNMVGRGLKPLVLDMANRYEPGGGVKTGSNAQEEILCRQSTLMRSLEKMRDKYPLPETGGILVRRVTFLRADPQNEYAWLDRPFEVDVFASAAYNCNEEQKANRRFGGYDKPDSDPRRPDDPDHVYKKNTKEKMRTMFRVAVQNGNDSLVLGAFGCGAFANNPEDIAAWYREVLDEREFQGRFREVVFAIVDDGKGPNYRTFLKVFAENRNS